MERLVGRVGICIPSDPLIISIGPLLLYLLSLYSYLCINFAEPCERKSQQQTS